MEKYPRRMCVPVLVVAAVAVLAFWWISYAAGPVAQAAPGLREQPLQGGSEQRGAMVAELVKVNARLDEIHKLLASGQVKVTVLATEDRNESAHETPQPTTDSTDAPR